MSSKTTSLMDKLKIIRKQTGVDIQIFIKKFFIDSFLKLLSESAYQDKFVQKGGFVLSAIAGIEKRTTVDIDTLITGVTLDEPHIETLIHQIIDGKEVNGVTFQLADTQKIHDEKEFTGYRVFLIAHLDNMRDKFHLDIATGETLVPPQISYRYQPLIQKDESFELFIYRTERMLAEKLQTILERRTLNTRSKDFFDVYLFSQLNVIDEKILYEAFHFVIQERNSENDVNNWKIILNELHDSEEMKHRWSIYQRDNRYVEDLSFEETLQSVENYLLMLS